MPARTLTAALAAVLGLASPALAFHPFQHWCGHHQSHHAGAMAVQSFGVQPMAVHSFGVQPMAVHSFGVQPMAVHSFGVQPMAFHSFGVQPMGFHSFGAFPVAPVGQSAEAQALTNLSSLLGLLRNGCSLINPPGNQPGGVSAADIQRIKGDLDAIRQFHGIPRKSDDGDGDPNPKKKANLPVEVSPRLARIDAGLDEIEAIQRRTDALRAAAARTRTTPAEVPAVTRRD